MAYQIKRNIAKSLYETFLNKINTGNFDDFLRKFKIRSQESSDLIWNFKLTPESTILLDSNLIQTCQERLMGRDSVKSVILNTETQCLQMNLDLKSFVKQVVDSDPTKFSYEESPKKVIVEFSSPNIAKPFHVGHLKSTILGNSISNIKKKLGCDVVKINYLGDWGTQFGMIELGMQLEKYSEEQLKKDPLEILYKAYVKGNAEAEKNENLYEQAKKIFLDLENGNEEIIQKWDKYKKWTVQNLTEAYNRLGVSFDEFSWESEYKRKNADTILKMLEEQGILAVDEKKRKVAMVDDKEYLLLKSDDTTLYLLRDLMAVADRRSKHGFDEMYYVVDNAQSEHFTALKKLCSKVKLDEDVKIEHVKFGRIHKMSTRKGRVVLLSNILDEAQERIYEIQKNSKNTKVPLESLESSDILGVSAVVVNDLKQKRLRDYEFSWEKSLQIKGDTGIALQYGHCRLCNLEVESGRHPASECDPEALMESEAIHLVKAIARYEEILWESDFRLEPCVLVKFMFDLNKAINIAYRTLNIKYNDEHVSSQRLLLFKRAREVLHEGLTLLGLKPLSKM